jgi:hypothetical protein
MDVARIQTAVKPAIPVIHEDGVIQRLNDARLFSNARKILVMLLHLGAQKQSRLFLFNVSSSAIS